MRGHPAIASSSCGAHVHAACGMTPKRQRLSKVAKAVLCRLRPISEETENFPVAESTALLPMVRRRKRRTPQHGLQGARVRGQRRRNPISSDGSRIGSVGPKKKMRPY